MIYVHDRGRQKQVSWALHKKGQECFDHGSFSRMDKSQTRTSHNLTHFSCLFFLPPALMMSMCKSRPLRSRQKQKRGRLNLPLPSQLGGPCSFPLRFFHFVWYFARKPYQVSILSRPFLTHLALYHAPKGANGCARVLLYLGPFLSQGRSWVCLDMHALDCACVLSFCTTD